MQMRSGGRKGEETENPHQTLQLCFVFHFPLSRVALLPRQRGSEKKERRITKKCLTGDGGLARAKETPK